MSHFSRLPEFEKEFKRLSKKYRTLEDDLEKFKKVLQSFPTGTGRNFTIVHSGKNLKVVKARMACQALRERSLRVIYAYFEQEQKIEFIEVYYKGNKENEDRSRMTQYVKKYQP